MPLVFVLSWRSAVIDFSLILSSLLLFKFEPTLFMLCVQIKITTRVFYNKTISCGDTGTSYSWFPRMTQWPGTTTDHWSRLGTGPWQSHIVPLPTPYKTLYSAEFHTFSTSGPSESIGMWNGLQLYRRRFPVVFLSVKARMSKKISFTSNTTQIILI